MYADMHTSSRCTEDASLFPRTTLLDEALVRSFDGAEETGEGPEMRRFSRLFYGWAEFVCCEILPSIFASLRGPCCRRFVPFPFLRVFSVPPAVPW